MTNSVMNTPSAMAIAASIDDMRHERLSLDKHLNLHEDKLALEEGLREFYRRNGVNDVTPELIEKAVAAYKKDRFTFKGWGGSTFGLKIAQGYLWLQPKWKQVVFGAFAGAMGVLIITTGLTVGLKAVDLSSRERAAASIHQEKNDFDNSLAKLSQEISDRTLWLKKFTQKSSSTAVSLSRPLMAVSDQLMELIKIRDSLSEWGHTAMVIDQKLIDADPRAAKEQWDAKTHGRIDELRTDLSKARTELAKRVAAVETLKSTSDMLIQVRESALFESYADQPDIAFKMTRAEMDFNQGKIEEARAGLDQVNQLIQARQNTRELLAGIETLEKQVAPIFKDDEGKERLQKLLAQAKNAAQQGNKDSYTRISNQIAELADFVATPLRMEITIGPNDRTGIERNYKTGPKRYFVVVHAIDATGTARPIDITDIETKKTTAVTMWAQAITKAGYDAIKKDKLEDGVLDDTNVGNKPSGNYSFKYNMPVLQATLTGW